MPNFKDRTGESHIMNNGLKAEIIAYRNCMDMDVQFENGEIVCNRTYRWFRLGKIRCPLLVEQLGDYARVTNANIVPAFTFLVDIEDLSIVQSNFWDANANGYVRNKKVGYLHRIIMNAPDDMDVDHKDGNTLDCRKSNLRVCAHVGNMCNTTKRADNTSGYKGVSWHKQRSKWAAQIHVKGKHISLGLHEDDKDAARAYNDAAIKYFGEFARLNDIP